MPDSNQVAETATTEKNVKKRLRQIERKLAKLEGDSKRQRSATKRLDRIERRLEKVEGKQSRESVGQCVHCWEGDLVRIASGVRCTACGYRFE